MPCPSCGSNNLWDDNLAWGCNRCEWFTTGQVHNRVSSYDRFGEYTPEPPPRPMTGLFAHMTPEQRRKVLSRNKPDEYS